MNIVLGAESRTQLQGIYVSSHSHSWLHICALLNSASVSFGFKSFCPPNLLIRCLWRGIGRSIRHQLSLVQYNYCCACVCTCACFCWWFVPYNISPLTRKSDWGWTWRSILYVAWSPRVIKVRLVPIVDEVNWLWLHNLGYIPLYIPRCIDTERPI